MIKNYFFRFNRKRSFSINEETNRMANGVCVVQTFRRLNVKETENGPERLYDLSGLFWQSMVYGVRNRLYVSVTMSRFSALAEP